LAFGGGKSQFVVKGNLHLLGDREGSGNREGLVVSSPDHPDKGAPSGFRGDGEKNKRGKSHDGGDPKLPFARCPAETEAIPGGVRQAVHLGAQCAQEVGRIPELLDLSGILFDIIQGGERLSILRVDPLQQP
jgi:hypothetical protein